jgi:LacI family transcriptional regulator
MRRLQLEDISKQLGYSKTLISMVLNGKGNQYGISKKTQATVMDAIAKLNYAPNKFAKSLRTGKSYFIGLIVSDVSNVFYSRIAKCIERMLSEHGYNLMVCSTDENEEREKLLVEMMVNKQGVDGLIIASTIKNASFYCHPRLSDVPMLFIDRVVPNLKANYVVIDNYGGSLELVNHLMKDGCKKIACFALTPSHLSTIEDRLNGYQIAIAKAGGDKEKVVIKEIAFDHVEEDVEMYFNEFLQTKSIPDAIFALNNTIAVAILKAQKKKEFSKLANIKIACFDDVEIFNLIDKKVISVSQPVDEIGKAAVDRIMEIITTKEDSKSNLILSTRLIER